MVVFAAAKKALEKKLDTKFYAVEINPILVLIANLRRLFHPNKKNIKILWQDMFKINFQTFKPANFITFYLYISPWFLNKIMKDLQLQIKKFSVVSYFYPLPNKKPKKIFKGKNKIFVY